MAGKSVWIHTFEIKINLVIWLKLKKKGTCVTFKDLPQPLVSHTQTFGTLGQLLKIPPFV